MNYCNRCKEKSVRRKVYLTEDLKKSRIEYCINTGCGYRLELPFKEVEYEDSQENI